MTSYLKATGHRLLSLFGIRVLRVKPKPPTGALKYFNTGMLSPLEENTADLYDRFYKDERAVAEYNDARRLSFYTEVSAFIRKQCDDISERSLLDVGCGTGQLIAEILASVTPMKLSGCDFSSAAVAICQKRYPSGNFFRHDIELALDDTYDIVVCTEVLEHLQYPHKAVHNLTAAVKEKGVLFLTVPNGRLDYSIEHLNFWSPESWKVFLERECPEFGIVTGVLREGQYNVAALSRNRTEVRI